MKRRILIGAISTLGGFLVIGTFALGGGGFSSVSPAYHLSQGDDPILEDSSMVWVQLGAAVQEVERTEPAYRIAQAEVKKATHQIKSFLPTALEASEPFNEKPGGFVAALGMKKAPMKENGSSLRFEVSTLKPKATRFERLIPSKTSFSVLRL